MKIANIAAAFLIAFSSSGLAESPGYGPWRLGMSRDEVAAIASHGPYSDVRSTSGLETRNAKFQHKPATVSFVFGPEGLRHIQVWAYEGQDLADALEPFTAYTSTFLTVVASCTPMVDPSVLVFPPLN